VIIAGIPIATVASAIARASIMTIPLDSASSSTSIGSLRNRFADQHLPHACFRRISPQRFWFRGLWRKPGQRFAVCGGNPAWQVHVSLLADMWPRWRLTHPELPGHKATLVADPDSMPTGTSIAKTYGGPMGYWRPRSAQTMAPMSQHLRRSQLHSRQCPSS
jgi:hypothetical protein